LGINDKPLLVESGFSSTVNHFDGAVADTAAKFKAVKLWQEYLDANPDKAAGWVLFDAL